MFFSQLIVDRQESAEEEEDVERAETVPVPLVVAGAFPATSPPHESPSHQIHHIKTPR